MLTLRWDQPTAQSLADFEASAFEVFDPQDQRIGRIALRASKTATAALANRLGNPAVDTLRDAMTLYALGIIEARLTVPAEYERFLAAGSLDILLDSYAVESLPIATRSKQCDRQAQLGRDLLCTAPSSNDETVSLSIEGRPAAPTSEPICSGCGVPDSRHRCSHLMHPQVMAIRTMGGGHERHFAWAVCNRGHQDLVTREPQKCVPERGHPCWERLVARSESPVEPLHPLALIEALDNFGDVWRSAFNVRILRLLSATDTALLSQPVVTRAEVVDRLRALATVLDSLVVSDDLLPSDLAPQYRANSLNRLENALRARLPADSLTPVLEAIETLRRILRLDNAFSHPTGESPTLWPRFGLANPPPSWPDAWSAVQRGAITAFRTLAVSVRPLIV